MVLIEHGHDSGIPKDSYGQQERPPCLRTLESAFASPIRKWSLLWYAPAPRHRPPCTKLMADRLGRLRYRDRELLAQGAESRFQLVEPGSMAEIEQPVHLRQVPVQPPGEFRLAHPGGPHCGIEGQLGFRQCRQGNKGPFVAGAGHRNLAAEVDVAHEGRLNGIRSAQKCFFSIRAEDEGSGDLWNLDQNRIVGVLGESDVITQHGWRSFLSTLVST